MLVPTILMGATFPLVSRSITDNLAEMGRKVGDAYSMNTVGAVVGSLMAGFVLIPLVGIKGAAFAAAGLNLAVGCLMLVISRRSVTAPVIIMLAAFCGAATWNWTARAEAGIFSFYNAYRYLDDRPYQAVARLEEAEHRELYRREFPEGSVRALRASNGSFLLQVGGKVEGTNIADIPNTVLLALIPIATHPAPRRLLNIGLGSGVTLGAAKPLVPSVELVEINPGVVEAVSLHGEAGLLDGVKVITDDARNYLFSTRESYDVISSEPSYPTESGVTSLFTREHYQIAASRLNRGGVYCQWLPYYILSTDDVTMMIKTFTSVFPQAFLWKIPDSGDLILIGSREPFSFTAGEISRRVEALNKGKYKLNYVLSRTPEQLAEVAGQEGIPLNTDDHPRLEFNVVNNILLGNLAEKNKQRKFQTR
jgi:spermidine synthase